MVNFGYPYNDIVICKDSTDYLVYYSGFYKMPLMHPIDINKHYYHCKCSLCYYMPTYSHQLAVKLLNLSD